MRALRSTLLLLLFVSFAHAADVATLSGKRVVGEIVSVDGKNVVIKVGDAEQTLPLTDLVMVDLGNAQKEFGKQRPIAVELTDGSLLHCSDFKIAGKNATLTLLGGDNGKEKSVTVPNIQLYTMLREAQDAKNKLDFQSIIAKRGKRDMLIRRATSTLDGASGTFGDGDQDGENIAFETENGTSIKAIQKNIHGMIFNQIPQGEKPPTVCRVIDVHKNVLYARAVAVKDKGLAVTTVSGVTIDYADLKEVSKLDFSSAVLQYLSDLNPLKVEETSDTGLVEKYGRDRNLDNEQIRMEGKVYPKGLSIHSTTTITFDIGASYKDFRATVGADDSANPDSSVNLRIEGDGRELWKGVVKRKEKPRDLALDVRNVKQLRITVAGEGTDLGNQLTLGDAKVTK